MSTKLLWPQEERFPLLLLMPVAEVCLSAELDLAFKKPAGDSQLNPGKGPRFCSLRSFS